jgi:hypothetical protein
MSMETDSTATIEATKPSRPSRVKVIAAVLWTAVLITILVRAGLHPLRASSLTTYLKGAEAWRNQQPIYTDWRGFVYPPAFAWFFALFSYLPSAVAAILWRSITACGFILGLRHLLKSGVYRQLTQRWHGFVYLATLPLAIGNIDNAQANPLLAGLLMFSVGACAQNAWTLCALAAGVAIILKVYPVALALLLCILRPRALIWRLAIIVALLAVLPFLFQNAHYVLQQYQSWLHGRLSDSRFDYPMKDAPLDLWYLLVRLWHLPVSKTVYMALQLVSAATLAAWVWLSDRRGVQFRDNLAVLFLFVSVWILLLGPATENQTYIILAPAASLVIVLAFCVEASVAARTLAGIAFALLLFAVMRNALLPHLKSPGWMAIQPIGAIILLAAVIALMPRLTLASPR